jgi:hypothetical protein
MGSDPGNQRIGDAEMQLIRQHGPEDLGLTELMAVTDAVEERRTTVDLL